MLTHQTTRCFFASHVPKLPRSRPRARPACCSSKGSQSGTRNEQLAVLRRRQPSSSTLMTTAALLSAVATAALAISDRSPAEASGSMPSVLLSAILWTLSLGTALSGLAFALLTEIFEPYREQGAAVPDHAYQLSRALINASGLTALCGLVPLAGFWQFELAAAVAGLLAVHAAVFVVVRKKMQAAVAEFQKR